MRDFEASTGCSFRFRIYMAGSAQKPDLTLICEAVPLGAATTGVAALAYEKCQASSAGLGNLMGLLTYLLYQVDFQLSRVEDEPKE
jgi:hypothetical protein